MAFATVYEALMRQKLPEEHVIAVPQAIQRPSGLCSALIGERDQIQPISMLGRGCPSKAETFLPLPSSSQATPERKEKRGSDSQIVVSHVTST